MHPRLLTHSTRLHRDQSVVLVGFGTFGRGVVGLAEHELARLGVPADRRPCLAIVCGEAGTVAPDSTIVLDAVQAHGELTDPASESLRAGVAHWLESATSEPIDGERTPAAALVAFHHGDEIRVTQRLRAVIDVARSANPEGRITCVVVAALGSGTASGMAVPCMARIRDHLRLRNVGLDVVFVTPDVHAEHEGAVSTSSTDTDRNAVAAAMLWEAVQRGTREFTYPGRDGVREDRRWRGPLADRTWVFSSGAAGTAHSEPVVGSIVAGCIATLVRTPLGEVLEASRSAYAESVLERTFADANGVHHPTQLLAMNVAGLKLDCLPSIFHLRAVRAFLGEVTQALPPEGEQAIRDSVDACLVDARLYDDAVVEDLGVGARPVTREEVAAARLPQEELHGWLSHRLEEDVGRLVEMANGRHDPGPTEVLLDRARLAISMRAAAIANGPEGYLPGAVLFYRTLQKRLETARASVLHRADLARTELGMTPNRDRLNVLLERLQRDTAPADGGRFNILERFVATITVSVPTQVRKILEVASEIRAHAQVVAAGTVLAGVYDRLAHFCESQREELQGRLYVLNNAAAQCMRDEELAQRAARAAFTYQRARFEPLVDHLCAELRQRVPVPAAAEVVARLGGDLPGFVGHEPHLVDGLLAAVAIDAGALAHAADAVLAADAAVRDALKESLAQFLPTVQVDRERLGDVQAVRSRFVVCTPAVYDAHREDVFEGYQHVATANPWEILCTDHEEGLPFAALAPMRRAAAVYKVLAVEGRAALGHPLADLPGTLALIDD